MLKSETSKSNHPTQAVALARRPAGYDRIVARCADTLAFVRECEDVAQVREVIAQTDAVIAYLEAKGDGKAIASAGEVRIVAERRLGELLAKTVKRGRPEKGKGNTALPFLSDLGLDKMQSSRAQQLAAVPAETFEAYVEESKAAGRAPSKNGLLKRAEPARKSAASPDAPVKPIRCGGLSVDYTAVVRRIIAGCFEPVSVDTLSDDAAFIDMLLEDLAFNVFQFKQTHGQEWASAHEEALSPRVRAVLDVMLKDARSATEVKP